MELTLNQLVNINKILSSKSAMSIPIQTAFDIAQVLDKCQCSMEFYQQQMSKFLQQYAEKNDDGSYVINNGSIKLKADCIEMGTQQLHELENTKITLDIKPFKLDQLATLNLTIQEVQILMPIIEKE